MTFPIVQITYFEHTYGEKGLTSIPIVCVGVVLEDTVEGYMLAQSLFYQPPIDQSYGKLTYYLPKTNDMIVKKIGKVKV